MPDNIPIEIAPGTHKNPDSTEQSTLLATDTLHVRYFNGRWRTVQGPLDVTISNDVTISGCPRGVYSYFYNGKYRYLIGTHEKLYEYIDGTLTNITPLKTTATLTLGSDPLATTNTSATITVTDSTAGRANGDRVKLTGAATTNGIPDSEINAEHIISNVVASTSFDITVTTAATSTGSGGGASIEVFDEIADGACDQTLARGYGLGRYNTGRWNTPKTSTTGSFTLPRIWSFDRYGNDVVINHNDDGKIYKYQNDNSTAPEVLSNAPSSAVWIWVNNESVGALGGGGTDNRISRSDRGSDTTWTAAATNKAFEDDKEGAGALISQLTVRGIDLLFTNTNQVYTHRYIGEPNLYETKLLDSKDGIIGPHAWAVVNGVAYWMGTQGFYMYGGGSVSDVPNNTMQLYIYENINIEQSYKTFCRVNPAYNEIEWWYPAGASLEPNEVARFNFVEQHWVHDTETDRTASEKVPIEDASLMTDSSGNLYRQEAGGNWDNAPYIDTAFQPLGNADITYDIMNIYPDSTQSGSLDVTLYTKLYQQSSSLNTYGPYTVNATTEKIDLIANGRWRQYRIEGNVFDLGRWFESVQQGTPL